MVMNEMEKEFREDADLRAQHYGRVRGNTAPDAKIQTPDTHIESLDELSDVLEKPLGILENTYMSSDEKERMQDHRIETFVV
jgi:hypothetical protein